MIFRLSACVLLLAAIPGQSQTAANANRLAAIPPATIRTILQDIGLPFTEQPAEGSTTFAFQFNGRAVTLTTREKSMSLSACFQDPIAPIKQNQWNRQHFSTGARRDDQGCTALQSDATFGGTFTAAMLDEQIRVFLTGLTIYTRFVAEPPPGNSAPPDAPISPVTPMEWSQSGQKTRIAPQAPDPPGSVPGLLRINRNISLKYDPGRWTEPASLKDGQLILDHTSGGAHALVIAEHVAVPRGSLEDVALANAQSADPDAAVAYRGQQRTNGFDVRVVRIELAIRGVPWVYWGGFYGGEYGTVQLVTYTEKARLPQFEKDITDLLAGFTVSK